MPKSRPLTPEEIQAFRKQLLEMRARLRGEVNELANTVLAKGGPLGGAELSVAPNHPAELGAENYEQQFAVSLIEAQSGMLEKIETALQRIEEGTYGICEECGCQIPRLRLKAVPYATMCVKCAEQYE
jgi:RNA polymerase-binding protein DksA